MNDDDDNPLRALSIEIHSILVAEQEPITASQLGDKYEDLMGYHIDAKRYGFPNLDALLSAMTSAVCLVPNPIRNAKPKYRAVSTAETKDIESLVRRQMTREEQMERKRTGSLPRRKVERPPTQFGAAYRYKSADPKGALPLNREEQQMAASTQKMVPVGGGSVSRFSAKFDTSNDMGDSVQPMTTRPPVHQRLRLVDDPTFHAPQNPAMAFGAQVMSASAYKQQQTQNNNSSAMNSRDGSIDQHPSQHQQSSLRTPAAVHNKKPPVAPVPPRQSVSVSQPYPKQQFEVPEPPLMRSECAPRPVSSASSIESHGVPPESIFSQMRDEDRIPLNGVLYDKVMSMFKKEGDWVTFWEIPKHLLSVFNLNPDFFYIEYNDESGVRVTLKKMFNRATLRCSGHSVRDAMEFDVAWITKTHNVLHPLQRYTAIAVVHMISPSTFIVASLFGNEHPTGARFAAIDKFIATYHAQGKLRKATNFNPGMGCLVCYKGVFARAVLISQSKTLVDHLRFVLMDIHAIVEVDVSNVFYILPELETKHVPCNIFLARIHGVGPIIPNVAAKYRDYIEQQTSSGESMTTVCIIRSVDRKYIGIDFAMKGEWVSERLLSRQHAPPYICVPHSRQISREKLPRHGVVFDIIKAMIEQGAFDFTPQSKITDTASLCYVPPEHYPNYKNIVKRISPPCLIAPTPRRRSRSSPQMVLHELEIATEEEPLKHKELEVEEDEEELPGLQAEERAPSADLSRFRGASPEQEENNQLAVEEKTEEEIKEVEMEKQENEENMTEEERKEKRLAHLFDLMDEIRSGEEIDGDDTIFASMMWSAISVSEDPNSAWNEQLKELATDFGSRLLGPFP